MNNVIKAWSIGYTKCRGGIGLFYGDYPTRAMAIEAHTKDYGRTWESCKRLGHFAVKVEIRPILTPSTHSNDPKEIA